MKVELYDEFDNNFTRGGFFGETWQRKRDGSPSHLVDSGKLSRSLRATIKGSSVSITSSEPYASIHNDGGEITVTRRMQRYFWAMHYRARNEDKKQMYKAMALKKVGSKIVMPQRQFVGDHPKIRKAIQEIVQQNLDEYLAEMANNINGQLNK